MRVWLRRLHRNSIWARNAIAKSDYRVNSLLRGYLPQFYLACALGGILGAYGGVPALRQTFGENYATFLGVAIFLAGVIAGAGEAFPKHLWRLEFYSAQILSGLIILYAAAVVVAGLLGSDPGRAAVGAFIYSMSVLPRWRSVDVRADAVRNGWR